MLFLALVNSQLDNFFPPTEYAECDSRTALKAPQRLKMALKGNLFQSKIVFLAREKKVSWEFLVEKLLRLLSLKLFFFPILD